MFKKTLAAVAVLGAFAGTAMAANVTLYGIVDEAVHYQSVKVLGQDTKDTYGMTSGAQSGSRWGVKGTEELGNGLTVGFQLESGFGADDGSFGDEERLFNRVSRVYLTGDFGTLSAGHDGSLVSGLGSVSYIYQYTGLGGTGWGDYTGSYNLFNLGAKVRADNTLTYVSPNFAGVTAYAQYSFNTDGSEEPSANDNNRYGALGLKYDMGAFSTGLVVDYLKKAETTVDRDDMFTVSYGASYDFGVAKVAGMAQYGKHMDSVASKLGVVNGDKEHKGFVGDLEGYALGLGLSAPAFGGTAFAQVNYIHAKDKLEASNKKFDGYGLGLAYSYPLSKRTSVYTYGSYNQFKFKGDAFKTASDDKAKVGEFGIGMTHKF